MAITIRHVLLLLAVVSVVPAAQSMSLVDAIPVVAQVKSLFQLLTTDVEGAKQTQLNFLNNGLITSQARSLFFLVTGKPSEALDIQKEFVANMEPLVDGTPVIGHAKAIARLIAGDNEGAVRIMESATATLGSVVGGVVGGPVGAIGGQVLMDAVISAIDKVFLKDKAEARGVFSFLNNSTNETAGDMFDAVASLGLAGIGAGKLKVNTAKSIVPHSLSSDMIPLVERPAAASRLSPSPSISSLPPVVPPRSPSLPSAGSLHSAPSPPGGSLETISLRSAGSLHSVPSPPGGSLETISLRSAGSLQSVPSPSAGSLQSIPSPSVGSQSIPSPSILSRRRRQ